MFVTCNVVIFMSISQPTLHWPLKTFTLLTPYPWPRGLYVTSVFSFIVIDDATKEVVYRDYIDISVAVATPRVRWEDLEVLT